MHKKGNSKITNQQLRWSKTNSNRITIFYYDKKLSCEYTIINFKNAKYVALNDEDVLRIIETNVIDSMQLSFKGHIFNGKGIYLMSSEYPQSDFLFPINDKKYIDLVRIQNKKYLL